MTISHGYAELDQFDDHLGDNRGTNTALKERAVESASRACDALTSRRYWLDENPSTRLYRAQGYCIPTADFTELVSIAPEESFGSFGLAVDATTYRPAPLNAPVDGEPYYEIESAGSLGWTLYQINATWGWPSVPTDVTQACLLIAARIYKRRETVTGTLGFDEFAMRLGRDDPDVNRLLGRFARTFVA